MVTFKYNQERLFRDDPDLHLLYWGRKIALPGIPQDQGSEMYIRFILFTKEKVGFRLEIKRTHYLRAKPF